MVTAVVFAACSSDGAVSTTGTSEETANTSPTTTQLSPSSATSSTQPTTTTVTVAPTLSDSGQSGFEDALGTSERTCVDADQIVAIDEPEMVGPPDNRQPVFDVRSEEILAGTFASVVNSPRCTEIIGD